VKTKKQTVNKTDIAPDIRSGFPIINPLYVTVKDGGLVFDVAKPLYRKLKFLYKLTPEELFEGENIDKAVEICDKYINKKGYDVRYGKNRIYKISAREDVNRELVQDSSEVILDPREYEGLTSPSQEQIEAGYICFGTVVDGRLVSIASENPHDEDAKVIDVGVETAEEYRGKGYGGSNVAALVYYLLDTGMTVEYTVDNENEVSIRLAERVGFKYDRFVLNIFAHKQE
jgi:RimJ/RimL family protein N-acetyltransferase